MKKGVQHIYCDESGSTGNKLLDRNQPIFSFATIAISPEEAQECVDKIIFDFKVQGGELKASKLLSRPKGKEAITRVLELQHDCMRVSLYDKKYSLACNIFEYTFEPVLASYSSIFYSIDFNKFIATILYLHLVAKARFAEKIFEDFEILMRELSDESASFLFSAIRLPKEDGVLDLIRQFCFHNRRAIKDQLTSLRRHRIGKWVLDLTLTALVIHLGIWGEKHQQLEVYCDRTKTLEGSEDLFKTMIDREEKIYSFFDQEQAMTFNLIKDISLVNSHDHPGVQLADIAAGAIPFALQNPGDPEAKKWREYFPEILCRPVWPEKRYIDLAEVSVQRNMMLLQELVHRSERGLPLEEGLVEFLYSITNYLIDERRNMP